MMTYCFKSYVKLYKLMTSRIFHLISLEYSRNLRYTRTTVCPVSDYDYNVWDTLPFVSAFIPKLAKMWNKGFYFTLLRLEAVTYSLFVCLFCDLWFKPFPSLCWIKIRELVYDFDSFISSFKLIYVNSKAECLGHGLVKYHLKPPYAYEEISIGASFSKLTFIFYEENTDELKTWLNFCLTVCLGKSEFASFLWLKSNWEVRSLISGPEVDYHNENTHHWLSVATCC